MMPCWYQRSTPTPPNTPPTPIYIVSVPCRTSYGLYRATCFLHVCQLLLRHLQAAQEQKSRADVTHKLTTCWWMIVKSSLTAAVLHKETRLSMSKNTDKHVHAYCSSAAETPFLSFFFPLAVSLLNNVLFTHALTNHVHVFKTCGVVQMSLLFPILYVAFSSEVLICPFWCKKIEKKPQN